MFRFALLLALVATLLFGAPATFASDVTCPKHPSATCYDNGLDCTGQACVRVYWCSCGDYVYVSR